jgi:hypothetical protein
VRATTYPSLIKRVSPASELRARMVRPRSPAAFSCFNKSISSSVRLIAIRSFASASQIPSSRPIQNSTDLDMRPAPARAVERADGAPAFTSNLQTAALTDDLATFDDRYPLNMVRSIRRTTIPSSFRVLLRIRKAVLDIVREDAVCRCRSPFLRHGPLRARDPCKGDRSRDPRLLRTLNLQRDCFFVTGFVSENAGRTEGAVASFAG